jgi:ABC-type nitrate/sulfonate/bicarbonate transport system permease component
MDRHDRTLTALIIALHGGLYFAIIMDRYEWAETALTIALH